MSAEVMVPEPSMSTVQPTGRTEIAYSEGVRSRTPLTTKKWSPAFSFVT
jgi:hypothetical protein